MQYPIIPQKLSHQERRYFFTNDSVDYNGTICRIIKGLRTDVKKENVPDVYPINLLPENSREAIVSQPPGTGATVQSNDGALGQQFSAQRQSDFHETPMFTYFKRPMSAEKK